MIKNKFVIAIIILGITLVSCEGPINYSVTVVDKLTRKPVDSVYVKVKIKRGKQKLLYRCFEGYTDSTGKYISTVMVGTGLGLGHYFSYMEYNKKGYSQKTEIDHTEGIVELEH